LPRFLSIRARRREDYAIVKYLVPLEAGISEDDVRVVILKNVFPSEDHAVLL